MLLNVLRIGDTTEQRIAHEGHYDTDQNPQNSSQRYDQALLGLDTLLGNRGIVEQPYVADLARLDELELLHIVQQSHVEVIVDLHVAHQPQGVLLHIGEGFHAGSHSGDLRV
ncbi:hypothetical protein D3C72_1397240 [compost metagenome]